MKKKYPFVKQIYLKDCASACTLMIIKYYNGNILKHKLDEMLKITKNGTSAYHIVNVLKQLGFEAYGIKGKIKDIKNHKLPCIANVIIDNSYKHFIVIYEINDKYILIADPNSKIKKITYEEFKKIWTGITIHMYPLKPILKMKEVSTTKIIKKMVASNIGILSLVFVLSISVTFLSVGTLLLFQKIIDKLNTNIILFISLLILLISKNIFDFIKNGLVIKLNKKIDTKILTDTFNKIIYLPYSYYQGKTTGEIISRIYDLNRVKDFISTGILSVFTYVPLVTIILFVMFYLNKTLFVFFIIMCIIYVITIVLTGKKTKNLIFKENYSKANFNSYMYDAIKANETIKGLGIEEEIIKKFEKVSKERINSTYKLDTFYNKIYLFKESMNTICQILLMLIGITLLNKGTITLGALFVYFLLMNYLFVSLNSLVSFSIQIKEIKEAFERVFDITSYKRKQLAIKKLQGKIELKNVSYSFDDTNFALKNINLNINPGEKILISGKSGSGKSTLLKVIKKFIKASGTVKIDDIDINSLDNKCINDYIVYVGQNEILFTGTIYDNLTLRGNNYKHSLKISEIDFTSPLGVYSILEENGFNLSGGQKQRLFLARALQNFNVLLIDEGLSMLDICMERKIIKNIIKKFPNKTVLFVSHRLDNLDLFDRFIVISKGEVILDEKKEG